MIERYKRPQPGEADHADPNFKPRVRECGKPGCHREFETTPSWRYFCPRCRVCSDIKKSEHRTFSISRK